MQGMARTLEEVFFSEEYAKKKGIVQSIDPRVKLVILMMLLIVLSFMQDIQALVVIYLLVLVLTWISKIELSLVIKRVWLTVALFSLLVVIPAMLNIVTPGDPIFTLLRFDSPHQVGYLKIPQEITITRQGLAGVTLFVLRVTVSVTLVLVVTLTTRWTELLKAIAVFRIPQIFILVLGMTYRYIFLLIRIVQNMFLAKKSRMIKMGTTGEEQAWVASRIGLLLKKSFKLSDDVYSAMRSRGFTGEAKSYDTFSLRPADFVALGGAGAACAALILYGLLV
jgi:cobalt/nickel transport system permease protein